MIERIVAAKSRVASPAARAADQAPDRGGDPVLGVLGPAVSEPAVLVDELRLVAAFPPDAAGRDVADHVVGIAGHPGPGPVFPLEPEGVVHYRLAAQGDP